MYALPNKTQHKFIVKVRGGISQKLDNFTSSQPTTPINSQLQRFQASSPLKAASLPSNSASTSLSRESALNRHIDEAGFGAELNNLVFNPISKNGNKQKSSSYQQRAQKQYITPEHNEMIKYVQKSWKGVERDYKKSVNNFINNIDLNGSSTSNHLNSAQLNQKQAKKKTATTSTPLLLSGSYHHSGSRDSGSARQDSFQPFDLEAFWGNRILKRLTEEL